MNTTRYSGSALERAAAAKLGELLESVPWLKGWAVERHPARQNDGFDLRVTVPIPSGRTIELLVQCKSDPRPSQFPYVVFGSPADRQPVKVFAAPYISPNMAQTCQDSGWSWFDLAGNCRLDVPGLLLLERQGNEPVHEPPRPRANLSTPESARVVRALLVPETVAPPGRSGKCSFIASRMSVSGW